MFIREREVKGRTDVNYYTARRLGDMAESLNQLARAFDDGIEKNGQLTKDDGLAAMQASAALVCDNCSRCNLYADSEKEDSYYLYYLLRAFEQKGHIDFEDMPQMFQSGCRKKEDYLAQLNRSLGRATMNLSWKNRFLESRDAVISQFRELSVILEEFSHQIDRARDITDEYEYILKKYFKRYHVALGNLICHKKGSGPKVLFAAHMDSIGLMVTYIDEKGFLRFGPVGGLSAHEVLGTPVRFANGTRGVLALEGKVEPKDMKLEHLYLDIGARNEAEAKAMVQVGDIAVYDTHAFCSGGRIFSPYLDDRIACAVLLMAMERLKNTENDLYFVFTVQEEVGLRGARTAAYGVAPDYGIAVDVTDSDDIPSAPHACSSVAGKGAAIKVMDSSVICHPSVVAKLEKLALTGNIPCQKDILRFGGTDAGAIHQSRAGVYTGGISIPTRYVHTPLEVADLGDVEACAALVAAFAQAKLTC